MENPDEALRRVTGPGGPFEIAVEDIRGIPTRAYQRGPRTLVEVLAQPGPADAETVYLVYGDERVTHAEHRDIVAGLAQYLRSEVGVGPGDRVALALRNYPEFVYFFWAALALGAIAVPLNAWWTEDELGYGLEDCGAVALVADEERLTRVAGLLPRLPQLRRTVSVRTEVTAPGVLPWTELRAALPRGLALPDVPIDPDDDCTILYTSGTTGRSRGAVHSHRNHCTNLINGLARAAAATPPGTGASEGWGPPPPVTAASQPGTIAHMPLFHITQLSSLYISLPARQKLVLTYRWDPEKALELIERERLTGFGGTPLHAQDLLDSPSFGQRDLSSLRSFGMGATAIPPEIVLRVNEVFSGRVAAGPGYGMTEATSAVTLIGGQEYIDHPDSVGRPTPVNEIRVVDEAGQDAPAGGRGELWVKGPNIVRGYWNNPEATALAFSDGWHHTGDVARLDDEGRVYIVDRVKDVVIRAGENIHTGEVEAVLYDHPAVRVASVVGLPHQRLGEELVAVVEVYPGSKVTALELQAHVAAKLARFKVPSQVIFIDQDLPRTATGKVIKREVRQLAQELANGERAAG
jgi:long-chain acyl-CoA synthetase